MASGRTGASHAANTTRDSHGELLVPTRQWVSVLIAFFECVQRYMFLSGIVVVCFSAGTED
jgi:hypothetical protein